MKKIDMNKLGGRETIRENSKNSDQVIKIELKKVVVREGFNVREDYGDIEELAFSILENGQVNPGRVDVLEDGRFVIVEGHRRFKALQLLAEKGHDPEFSAIVNGKKTTEEQRVFQMFTTQQQEPLKPLEIAALFGRLEVMGFNAKTIAQKIGKSSSYVSKMLELNNEPEHIKNEIRKGTMTGHAAIKLKREINNPEERVAAVQGATKNKHGKITTKEATGKSPKEKKLRAIVDAVVERFNLDINDVDSCIREVF